MTMPTAHPSIPGRARTACTAAVAVLVLVVASAPVLVGPARPAMAGAPAPGAGLAHPRTLFAPGEEPALRARLEVEPYRTVFLTSHARAQSWRTTPLDDDTKEANRDRGRAAKALAFEYALDRTVIGGEIVPFPDPAARQAVGDEVRDILLAQYPRSRMAVPPPLGGWDRDISTSEEIINHAVALDLLLGAGYDLGEHRADVVAALAGAAGELHLNYVDPSTADGNADIHQNNHRSKSGMAMVVAAVVLADDVPDARAWFDDGVLLVEDVVRHIVVAGDGGYAEGPFYWRFTTQNLAPFLLTWERVLGDGSWTVGEVTMPDLEHDPWHARTLRWMMDMTRPDGSLVPIDDGNPGRSHYFGAAPPTMAEAAAHRWRWAHAPTPFETDGNIDLAPESIAFGSDGVAPAPPWWSPTQFHVEGGTAVLRSGWDPDDTYALVLGEHDTAALFGRDRDGRGRGPQGHEHAEPGAFLLDALGERLVLDPGYLSFPERNKVAKSQDHSMVLVDGQGPPGYIPATVAWLDDPFGRPPAEGMATLHAPLDGEGLDAVAVATEYRDTEVQRRFLLVDDAYLVVGDDVRGPGGSLSWMLHGNGGGTSGGTFAPTAAGGRWTVGGARLDGALGVADATPTLDTVLSIHEMDGKVEATHEALRGTIAGGSALAVQVAYPTPVGQAPPSVVAVDEPGVAGLDVEDPAGDRRVAIRRSGDGLSVVDRHLDGSLRLAMGDGATSIADGDELLVHVATPGTLGVRLADGAAHVVADTPDRDVEVGQLGFDPVAVDGACGLRREGERTVVATNRESRFTLRAQPGDGRPAADAGRDRRVAAGAVVVLDGSASCDPDGGSLSHRWELVSAPAGASWTLDDATTVSPRLRAEVPGPYRVRLVVTDGLGSESLADEVLVMAGARCGDGRDDDLDGLIDTDDPDCDALTGFLDVTATHPFHADITWLLAEGVTTGAIDETFAPERALTRAEMAAWLYRAAGSPDGPGPSCASPPFVDVAVGSTFCGEIAWMRASGLAVGHPGGDFRPSAPVDRQSFVAFLYRRAGQAAPCTASPFPDVGSTHLFCADVDWARRAGVTFGFPDGTFRPGAPVTRQAAAAFLRRAIQAE